MFYPGKPPPTVLLVVFVTSAVCCVIYFLITDFWIGFWSALFISMGLWGDIARFIRKLITNFVNGDGTKS